MRTRKTLEQRLGIRQLKGVFLSKDHIRAELDRLARRVRKLQRFAPAPIKGCHCQICRMHDHVTGAYLNRNDVLALIKELRK